MSVLTARHRLPLNFKLRDRAKVILILAGLFFELHIFSLPRGLELKTVEGGYWRRSHSKTQCKHPPVSPNRLNKTAAAHQVDKNASKTREREGKTVKIHKKHGDEKWRTIGLNKG